MSSTELFDNLINHFKELKVLIQNKPGPYNVKDTMVIEYYRAYNYAAGLISNNFSDLVAEDYKKNTLVLAPFRENLLIGTERCIAYLEKLRGLIEEDDEE